MIEIFNQIKNTLLDNTLFKLLLFIGIFFIIQPVITNIFIFFGIESENVYMYMSWIMFLLFLLVILPFNNGLISLETSVK